MKRKQSDHLLHVQALRGYCAITVALGHLFGMAGGMKSNLLTHHNVLDIALAPTRRGAECVMLFMFLSGYSLYRSKKLERWDNESSINKYFKRRFWRIYPTYIIAVLISYTIIYLARNLCMAPEKSLNNFTPIDFPGFLSHLFFLHSLSRSWIFQANPPLWSMAAEVQAYAILPFLFSGKNKRQLLLKSILLFLTIKILLHFTHLGIFSLLYFFLAGAIFFEVEKTVKRKFAVTIFQQIICIALILASMKFIYLPQLVSDVRLSLLFGGLLLFLDRFANRLTNSYLGKVLLLLGTCSYSLYVIHFPFALITWSVVARLNLSYPLSILGLSLLGPIIIGAPTFLLWKLVEKPSLERMKK